MRYAFYVSATVYALFIAFASPVCANDPTLKLTLRERLDLDNTLDSFPLNVRPVEWPSAKTAVLICDMWDKHWCLEAAARVAEMAPRMNQFVAELRKQGVLVVHSPSETMEFYKDHPARKRAQAAPAVAVELLEPHKEGPYPIEVVQGGCTDANPDREHRVWNRQIDLLEIKEEDVISDNGDEVYNVLRERRIENLIICGVHTNMCITHRPFAIKAMVRRGLIVALVRDLTDSMYSPKGKPHVDHFTGTDLVIEWLEKYWCPTISSDQVLGGKPFRFADDTRPASPQASPAPEPGSQSFDPTSSYQQRTIEGWRVFVNRWLLTDEPQMAADAERLMQAQLYEIVRRVPAPAVAKLREIPIWLELNDPHHPCAAYHPDVAWLRDHGMNPDKARCVEIANARNFLTWTIEQPTMLLHELAHGFHDRFLPGGHGNLELRKIYDHAKSTGLYANVLNKNQKRGVAYGMNNPMEYFAESTEAFFATNDFYPFVRWELQDHDPQMCQLVEKLWACGEKAENQATLPRLVIVCAEDEYKTEQTLPAFADQHLKSQFDIKYVFADPQDRNRLVGLEALDDADLAIFSIRRRTPPREQLDRIRAYLKGGKPLIAIRTTSHAFSPLGDAAVPPDHDAWLTFDRDVLGCHYEGHYGNSTEGGPQTVVWVDKEHADSPLVEGVSRDERKLVGSLYKSHDLSPAATVLMRGKFGEEQIEPVAWTIETKWRGKVFYTMLGHPDDFRSGHFQRLLLNAVEWAAKPGLDAQALEQKFTLPDDLEMKLVLSEPQIAQPLHISFDERGRMWVVEYRQYPHPAGLKIVSHDIYYRNIYDKVPLAPPNHTRGKDRISIHEDADGDGEYESHKVFVDGLNIATSAACDGDGVWILNPPYLLFYPDRNHDDVPDGDPEVHLSGFGIEDTHSVTNSLRFGPDGWLYGAHGSTVSMNVRRVGIDPPDKPGVQAQGQLIWRYQPTEKRFEVFAEGGGNAFGLEIDAKGRVFSGHNGGDTRGFHYMQGAYLQKGFTKHGSLSNPNAFGYFPAMKHDQVPRFTHEFVIYDRGSLPANYHGKLFGVAPLLNYVSISEITPDRSTFATKDIGFVKSSDTWFRPVDIAIGPDGALYVADWYDQQCAHTRNHDGEMEDQRGHIYRLQAKGFRPRRPENLGIKSAADLVHYLDADNTWVRQTVLRLLGDRKDKSIVSRLESDLFAGRGQRSLESLWALYQTIGLNETLAIKAMEHADPYVRLWTVRLLTDDGQVTSLEAERLVKLAAEETNVAVRAQLACSARRLPMNNCLPIVRALVAHDEDTDDPRLPLLIWWAIEQHAASHAEEILAMLGDPAIFDRPVLRDHILPRVMQRYAASGKRQDLLVCARLLALAPQASKVHLMGGFEAAFRGRTPHNLPPELISELTKTGNVALGLRIRLKEPAALAEAVSKLADPSTPVEARQECAELLGEIRHSEALQPLLEIACGEQSIALRQSALAALDQFSDPQIATRVLAIYDTLPAELQSVTQNLLASRADRSLALLNAVKSGHIAAEAIPGPIARKLLLHKDQQIATLVQQIWGNALQKDQEKIKQERERLTAVLNNGHGSPYDGKKLFRQQCAKCHTLFSDGGQIGPDLTSHNRSDVANILGNILDPSAEIREGFETFALLTSDGRALSGFLADQDQQVVAIKGYDGQITAVPREEIESMRSTGQSLMPQGLLDGWTDQQVRDLFSYLRSTQPLND